MPDAAGVTPERAQSIDKASLVKLSSSLDGISVETRGGEKTSLLGAIASKRVRKLPNSDSGPYYTVVPRWETPFGENLKVGNTPLSGLWSNYDYAMTLDGRYIALATSVAPYVYLAQRSGADLSLPVGVTSGPAGIAQSVAWSSDGAYLAVASTNSTPYLNIYKRSGATLTKLTPPTSPSGQATGVAWSPDGLYLYVVSSGSPYINIYSRSGDTLTQLANPSVLPNTTPGRLSITNDGAYLAMPQRTNPNLAVYKITGATLTRLVAIEGVVSSNANVLSWDPSGVYLALGLDTSSSALRLFKRNVDSLTQINVGLNVKGEIYSVAWSIDGQYLAVSHNGAPFLTIYRRSGDSLTKLTTVSSPPTSYGRSLLWTPDGQHLIVQTGASPWVQVYKAAEDVYGGVPTLIP